MDYDAKREHFHRPKYPELFDSPKIMFSGISGESSLIRSCYDEEQYYTNHNVLHAALLEGDILDHHSSQDYEIADNATDYELKYIAALVNSKLVTFYFKRFLATGTLQGTYSSMYPEDIRKLPVNESFSESCVVPDTELELSDLEAEPDYQTVLSHLTDRMRGLNDDLAELNTHVLDYLGSYTDGQTLADVGFTQPPENAAESILQETTEQRPNLRVGDCDVDRESEHTVTIHLAARYKPDESGNHDDADPEEVGTDRWGYRTTELLPALRITDLTETEADLIEAFIPHAVDKANGFANFRETATKTNSLVDRLRKLTLPRVADVEQGLTDYREAVARADELEKEIERTDELIDEIVYDLYELTDEEIEIVEESVGD